MEYQLLFPFAHYWHWYLTVLAVVVVVLLVDLGLFSKKLEQISLRKAVGLSAIWIGLGLVAGLVFYYAATLELAHLPNGAELAKNAGLEYLSGFLVEKSLAVDNLFVFLVIFNHFGVPLKFQHRVLFYGIFGALFFRSIFIALGAVIFDFHFVEVIFGLFLAYTGYHVIKADHDEKIDPSQNKILQWLARKIPLSTEIKGKNFFVREGGKLVGTPLLLCLLFIEISDIVFAVDSVPAIFGLTKEPFIVFASNVFAILGLRALYFVLASAMQKFDYLKYSLGVVLIFVGAKMAFLDKLYHDTYHEKFPVSWSLGFIVFCFAMAFVPKRKNSEG